MGLDITAYPAAELTPEHTYDPDACYEAGHRRAFCYAGHEHAARGLALDADVDAATGIRWGRCYQVDEAGAFGFRAGSYGGYNDFRERLSRYALGVPPQSVWSDPAAWRDRPFYELVNFADNEGTIGPAAAADLAADFATERDRVRPKLAHAASGDWYQAKYDAWQRAFALAAHHGIVVFH